MVDAVIADDVALVNHPLNQLRLGLNIRHGDKKDCRHLFFQQHIQNCAGIAVLVPFVKGKIDFFLVFPDKIRTILTIFFLIGGRTAGAVVLIDRSARTPSKFCGIQSLY